MWKYEKNFASTILRNRDIWLPEKLLFLLRENYCNIRDCLKMKQWGAID